MVGRWRATTNNSRSIPFRFIFGIFSIRFLSFVKMRTHFNAIQIKMIRKWSCHQISCVFFLFEMKQPRTERTNEHKPFVRDSRIFFFFLLTGASGLSIQLLDCWHCWDRRFRSSTKQTIRCLIIYHSFASFLFFLVCERAFAFPLLPPLNWFSLSANHRHRFQCLKWLCSPFVLPLSKLNLHLPFVCNQIDA